jgi:hypothetical protein
MRLYAERPGRRLGQVVLDLLALALLVGCLLAGRGTYHLVGELAAPGRELANAGTGFAGSVDRLGDKVDNLPGIGDGLRAPFDAVADGGRGLQRAGQAQQDVVHRAALVLGWAVGLIPAVVLLLVWLPGRVRWVRDATVVARLRAADSGNLAVFALRAVARRPLRDLRRATADPGADLARGDYAALAALELRALGFRTDRPAAGGGGTG